MQDVTTVSEIEQFLVAWREKGQEMEQFYRKLYEVVNTLEGVEFDFLGRPGVSYSLRPNHPSLSERQFFAILDVIDDEPEDRWLSICFYSDLITDPEERGEVIPGGLAGVDGYCFDVYSFDEMALEYLKTRLIEAYNNVVAG